MTMATTKQLETLLAMAKERGLDTTPIYAEQADGKLVNARVDFLFKLLKSKPRLSKPGVIIQSGYGVKVTVQSEPAAEGFYVKDGEFFKVTWNRSQTRRYARVLRVEDGKARWYVDGAKSMVWKLTEADRLTPAQAKAFGDLHHFCVCCGKELTVPLSVERGIGPVCWDKLGF
jgi:hypothetical protein